MVKSLNSKSGRLNIKNAKQAANRRIVHFLFFNTNGALKIYSSITGAINTISINSIKRLNSSISLYSISVLKVNDVKKYKQKNRVYRTNVDINKIECFEDNFIISG